MNNHWKPYVPGLLLLLVSVIIALGTYQQYGVSWDEPDQRYIGLMNANYIFRGDTTMLHVPDKDHGAGFELPLVGAEWMARAKSYRDIDLLRHLLTHLFFLGAAFAGYVLAWRLFGSRWIASLAFVMLAFHPRMWAHSWMNTKDIPLQAMFVICFALCERAFRRGTVGAFILLGLACGYTVSIRLSGILLPAVISLFMIADIVRLLLKKQRVAPVIKRFALFVISAAAMMYLWWPTLWRAPVTGFLESYASLSHFRWAGALLLNGSFVNATKLPWYYLPEWFSITMPELWLLAGFVGLALIIVAAFRRPRLFIENTTERNFLLYLLCFALPVASVFIIHPVMYDDWRHFYFLYPSFVFAGLYAVRHFSKGRLKRAVQAAFAIQAAALVWIFISLNPVQQVYFNAFVPHTKEYLRAHFELDYWGCSYKQGIEWILAHDDRNSIRIAPQEPPFYNNYNMLPNDQRARIQPVQTHDRPDYFITDFRMHTRNFKYPKVAYRLMREGSTVLCIYDTRP